MRRQRLLQRSKRQKALEAAEAGVSPAVDFQEAVSAAEAAEAGSRNGQEGISSWNTFFFMPESGTGIKKLPDYKFRIKKKTGKRYHIKKPTIDNLNPVSHDILLSS